MVRNRKSLVILCVRIGKQEQYGTVLSRKSMVKKYSVCFEYISFVQLFVSCFKSQGQPFVNSYTMPGANITIATKDGSLPYNCTVNGTEYYFE